MGRLRSWLRTLLGGDRTGHDQRFALLEREIQAINKFPDQNPNPVMRFDRDGHLLYANRASDAVIEALGVSVGETLAGHRWAELEASAAASSRSTIELESGGRTFALLPVDVPELDVINLYATDITAAKALDKFPDRNPNPVLRVARDGRLIYANPASAPICRALGATVGGPLPAEFAERVLAAAETASGETIEIRTEDRIFELLVVSVYEFDAINVYGTDVTAAREVERANAENERLLLNILPASIADRLRRGEVVIADRFDEMTVLFADVVGFTQLSLELSPAEIVETLNAVFSAFDRLAERHGLEKIKTIGDAYMVVGGLTDDGPAEHGHGATGDHARRVAEMGLEMLAEAARLSETAARPLEFRLGMHTGPAVAGVIGIKKFIYDVWGDTVNTASRMESHGVPGRVQVTEATYLRLRDAFAFEPRGLIDVKGKGPLATYLLVGALEVESDGHANRPAARATGAPGS
ncbi:MAG: adenylate/guanylate cyclase domain-containing protein [Candidatus Limnocylindrales bacterium]